MPNSFNRNVPAGWSKFWHQLVLLYLLTEVPLPQTDQSCAQVNGIEHAMYIWRREETLTSNELKEVKLQIEGTKIWLADH